MAARLTAAEARAIGLDVKPTRARTTRKVAKGRYHTTCHTCGEHFMTIASEDRHLAAHPDHRRYELAWGDPP